MLCDKYKKELIEAAASSAALPGPVNEHLSLCVHCHGIFAAQQSLFALVDVGLHSRVNVTVPGNFDDRVRAASQIRARQEDRNYSAVLACGSLAAAAAVLMAILLAQNLKHGAKETARTATVESNLLSSPHPTVLSSEAASLRPSSPRSAHSHGSALGATQGSKASVRRREEPKVLVPEGQEELLAKYMEGIAARKARVTFSADLQHEPNMKPVEVPSIEISELVVKPLSDLSSN